MNYFETIQKIITIIDKFTLNEFKEANLKNYNKNLRFKHSIKGDGDTMRVLLFKKQTVRPDRLEECINIRIHKNGEIEIWSELSLSIEEYSRVINLGEGIKETLFYNKYES